jgi:hypothetical protein
MIPISATEQAQIDINAKLRLEIATLKRRLETDEGGGTKEPKPKTLPGVEDTSSSDDEDARADEFEPDPDHPGSFRLKKKPADQDQDQDQDQDEEAPTPSAASIAGAKIFALRVCNAARKAHGQKPLSRLHDESVLPADGRVPTDPQQFARCVCNASRKAHSEPPISDSEWASLRAGW